jgi:hypothetical protein
MFCFNPRLAGPDEYRSCYQIPHFFHPYSFGHLPNAFIFYWNIPIPFASCLFPISRHSGRQALAGWIRHFVLEFLKRDYWVGSVSEKGELEH